MTPHSAYHDCLFVLFYLLPSAAVREGFPHQNLPCIATVPYVPRMCPLYTLTRIPMFCDLQTSPNISPKSTISSVYKLLRVHL